MLIHHRKLTIFTLIAITLSVLASLPAVTHAIADLTAADKSAVESNVFSLLNNASAAQRQALQDGFVTPDEHERAISDYAECASDAGLNVAVEPGYGYRSTTVSTWSTSIGSPDDADGLERTRSVTNDCWMRFVDAVDAVWAMQLPRASETDLMAQADEILACVNRGGIPGKSTSGMIQWDSSRSVPIAEGQTESYIQCARANFESTGVMPPAPRYTEPD